MTGHNEKGAAKAKLHHEEIDEESWDIRETYAYFGSAFYMASCLEVGLAHALMYAEFLMEVKRELDATKGKGFDRKQYEANFDAYMNKQFSQTMGNIIKRVNAVTEFSDELKEHIAAAKKRRDFLTHHYWRERSIQFSTASGRANMREELQKDITMFHQVDRDIDIAMSETRKKLKISDKMLEQYNERYMRLVVSGEIAE
jgi:hypothetical protein